MGYFKNNKGRYYSGVIHHFSLFNFGISFMVTVIACLVALVLGVIALTSHRAQRNHKRIAFIRRYRHPQGLLAKLAEKHPPLTPREQQLVTRGLRKYSWSLGV